MQFSTKKRHRTSDQVLLFSRTFCKPFNPHCFLILPMPDLCCHQIPPPQLDNRLHPTSTFPCVATFKIDESLDAARLYANHFLVPIRDGSEVTHPLCFLRPWVPDHDFVERWIGSEFQCRLLVL